MVFERGAWLPRFWRGASCRERAPARGPGPGAGLGPGDGPLAAEGVQLLEGGFWEVDALAKGGRLVEAEVVVLTIGDAASWRFPWPEQLSSADEQLNVFDCRAIGCSSGSPARGPSPTWPTGVIA
jgi:hypothetical protein